MLLWVCCINLKQIWRTDRTSPLLVGAAVQLGDVPLTPDSSWALEVRRYHTIHHHLHITRLLALNLRDSVLAKPVYESLIISHVRNQVLITIVFVAKSESWAFVCNQIAHMLPFGQTFEGLQCRYINVEVQGVYPGRPRKALLLI